LIKKAIAGNIASINMCCVYL